MSDAAALDAAMEAWAALPGVRYVQPNHQYRLDRAQAPISLPAQGILLDSLGHLKVIGIPDAWEITRGSATVRVGVVDTGLWFDHPAFEGQVAINAGEDLNGNGRLDWEDFNGIDDDGNGYVDDIAGYDFVDRSVVLFGGEYRGRDGDPGEDSTPGAGRGHGTAVSGALVARTLGPGTAQGAAPGVRIVPLRAFGADGIGEDDDIAAAIVYAADMRLDVLNLSFGDVYYSPLMRDAIAYATSRGVLVVASGGNDGMSQPHYPSDYPDVLSVAWLTADGMQRNGRASRGAGIDIGAPGSQIYTTLFRPAADPSQQVLYGRESGSSMAAPLVSGVAALLKSVDPSLSPAALRAILTATARDIEAPGWDEATGAGVVQAARALSLALPARVALIYPRMDAGLSTGRVPVIATALDPALSSVSVEVAAGIEEPFTWVPLASERTRAFVADTIAYWNVDDFDEGLYTLRLRVARTDGSVVEDRARVTLDASRPVFTLLRIRAGLVGDAYGILADVETDDRTDVQIEIAPLGRIERSDRLARRHGILWRNERRDAGTFTVAVQARNVAGLVRDTVVTVQMPQWQADNSRFATETLDIPGGYQLPIATDFDGDGIPELVLNQAPDGAIGDTLAFWEPYLNTFVAVDGVIATVIPRSAGDTNGDGRGELLTQVRGATLLLEAPAPGAYPTKLLFADTTGLSNPSSPDALFGAVLADLDGDGLGEIIGHNTRQIRVLERRANSFIETARLAPPDGISGFAEPDFRVADLNRNGRPEVIAPGTDGSVVAFEAIGNDTYSLAWTIQTDEVSPRTALTTGDFDGDGKAELVFYTQNEPGTRTDREQEPAFGTFRVVSFASGTDVEVATIPVFARGSAFAGVASVDFDSDGNDELVLSLAPDLYVLKWQDGRFEVIYHEGDRGELNPTVVRSAAITTGDFNGDGQPEVLASYSDGRVHRLQLDTGLRPAAPEWRDAYARNDSTVVLRWYSVSDSVEVYAGAAPADMAKVTSVSVDSLVLFRRSAAQYALRAFRGGQASPFSPLRSVRPHPPGKIVRLSRPAPDVIVVETDVPLSVPVPGAIRVGVTAPVSALRVEEKSARFSWSTPLQEGERLTITGLTDTSGTPIPDFVGQVPPVEVRPEVLYVTQVNIVNATTVRLQFSAPIDVETVIATNFSILPHGTVTTASRDSDDPTTAVLTVQGVNLGPTGLNVRIQAKGVRGVNGTALDPEGSSALLARPAADLSAAFVFPNPVRLSAHGHLTLGGVPTEVEATVLSVDGAVVRRLQVDSSSGGLQWDLRDEAGQSVPSGMYLVRLMAPGSTPILLKAALIR